ALTTVTGRALSCGVPAMNEPVTTTSLTSAGAFVSVLAVAVAAAVAAMAEPAQRLVEIATATADAPQKYLRFIKCLPKSRARSIRRSSAATAGLRKVKQPTSI